jgi:multidrug efflux pump subunit AcrB
LGAGEINDVALRHPHAISDRRGLPVITMIGSVSVVRMPVDLFPAMNIPVVAVATFYSGMPPEQVEGNITYHLERFFTLASGIDHMESRSLSGVSLIKVYFQPGTIPTPRSPPSPAWPWRRSVTFRPARCRRSC